MAEEAPYATDPVAVIHPDAAKPLSKREREILQRLADDADRPEGVEPDEDWDLIQDGHSGPFFSGHERCTATGWRLLRRMAISPLTTTGNGYTVYAINGTGRALLKLAKGESPASAAKAEEQPVTRGPNGEWLCKDVTLLFVALGAYLDADIRRNLEVITEYRRRKDLPPFRIFVSSATPLVYVTWLTLDGLVRDFQDPHVSDYAGTWGEATPEQLLAELWAPWRDNNTGAPGWDAWRRGQPVPWAPP